MPQASPPILAAALDTGLRRHGGLRRSCLLFTAVPARWAEALGLFPVAMPART